MKKCIGWLTVFCMCLLMVNPVFAQDDLKYNISEADGDMQERMMDIPIFVVTSVDGELTDAQKASASIDASQYCEGVAVCANRELVGYDIVPLNDEQKQCVLESPVYASAFATFKDMVDEGVTVKYINLYTCASDGEEIATMSSSDLDDEAYWERNFTNLGTCDGYKFLYSEVSGSIETSEVEPENLTASLKWDVIAKKTLEMLCDHYVKNDFYKTVKTVADTLSTIFSAYTPPLSISYSSSTEYLKARVSGDIYVRTVYIRDDLNRLEGYAYYEGGTTQRLSVAMSVRAKYPCYKNPSGTYEYKFVSHTYDKQNSATPGYYGNTTFYRSIIQLYSNTHGNFRHEERIDINSAVTSLIN